MTLLRILILAVVMALGTVLVSWWVIPLAGAVYGVVARATTRPALVAALAAAVAWGGYLSILAFSGAPVGAFAGDLARAMSLPGWAPHIATMVFPAVLAGSAALGIVSLFPRRMQRPGAPRR
jgi:hypothetical protein